MNRFSPQALFDLDAFEHAPLFKGLQFAWEALPRLKEYLDTLTLGNVEGEVLNGAYLIHPETISIGAGTVVEPGAYIQGPCYIGKNCEIRHGAYIRGHVIAGDGCVIGHATEVKNSLFFNRAKAGHFAYVGDSILGHDVNLGAGTKLANLRFDRQNIVIRFLGDRLETGIKKFGALLGDRSQTGCNAVTNPGTVFGKEATCFPCENARGVRFSATV